MCATRRLTGITVLLAVMMFGAAPEVYGEGACCTDGDCTMVLTEEDCVAVGGIYLDGADCADDPCAVGACCAALTCMEMTAYQCITSGRDFMGAGTHCDTDPCGYGVGACCIAGVCTIISPEECDADGGTFLGYGTNCVTAPCTLGACCLPGECQDLARYECVALEGEFVAGAACEADPCTMDFDCPLDALFSQSRDVYPYFMAYTSDADAGYRRFENFAGVAGPIEEVLWWGFDLEYLGGGAWAECDETHPIFQVTFHEDAGGVPGDVVCAYTGSVGRLPTGILYGSAELMEYSLPLPEPCVLTCGWLSVVGEGGPDCWFLWISAGPGESYCEGCSAAWEGDDLSFCLLGPAGGVFGACCDDTTGVCTDNVEISDCVAPEQRHFDDETCDELDPPCGVLPGACCFADGSCEILEEPDCIALGGNWLGAFTPCWLCPCVTPCPAGGVLEGEPVCYDGYIDEFNGGCDADTVVFSPIALCEPVCGQSGMFVVSGSFVPDYDWYEIEITEATDLTWEVVAEFEAGAWIVDGRAGCAGGYVMDAAGGYECDVITVTVPVEPGVYWLVTGPIAATDAAACGAHYVAVARPGAPCPGDFDGNGDIDDADFGLWSLCLSGPDIPVAEDCDPADFDWDDDADLHDVAGFQRFFAGAP